MMSARFLPLFELLIVASFTNEERCVPRVCGNTRRAINYSLREAVSRTERRGGRRSTSARTFWFCLNPPNELRRVEAILDLVSAIYRLVVDLYCDVQSDA